MAGKQRDAQHGLIRWRLSSLGLLLLVIAAVPCFGAPSIADPEWQAKIRSSRWIAYAPSHARTSHFPDASPGSLLDDLLVLRQAGFTGILTYTSSGLLSTELPALAEFATFEGIILGIWNPLDAAEVAAAKAAAASPIVLGFCVGNEGLGKRYSFADLAAVIADLRAATGKPVTTTEELEDYRDDRLLALGDWVFPNAHPIHNDVLDPESAVRWTRDAYYALRVRSGRFVVFKEVGLPTAGAPGARLSESGQLTYYARLAETDVQFVYFEAFDQPWKTHLPIEPFWGLFRADRSPKQLGLRLMGGDQGGSVVSGTSAGPSLRPNRKRLAKP